MFSCKIKLNFISPDPNHYLNFVVVSHKKNYKSFEVNKSYLIGTNILQENNKSFTIILNDLKGVKFKFLIRKYLKKIWKVKVKDINIKHIHNIKNNHNYLVLVKNLNKQLKVIKNCINSLDKITWRTFYEIYTPTCENDFKLQKIYSNFRNISSPNISQIKINTLNVPISVIYYTMSKIM